MELREKVGQLFMVGFEGLTPPGYILEWLAAGRIAGVILFARNVESPQQLARMTAALHAAAKHPCLISIDQEGGTVARLRDGFTESPGAMALSVAGDAEQIERVSHVLGTELRALGINWNYAPVLDILYNVENPSLGTRSFGTTAEKVGRFAAAAVRGFQRAGVAACAKHFPGLGDTPIDTHIALPTLNKPLDALIAEDLAPYRAVIGDKIAAIMTTHTRFAALDSKLPTTMSPVVVNRLLRQELGYDGLVTTDCMEMKAIADNYGAGESAVLTIAGGIDMVLFSHTRAAQEAAYDAVIAAVESGRIPIARINEANRRVDTMRQRFAIHNTPNLDEIRTAEHLATVNQAARSGTVMLKNDGVLPLHNEKVVVIEFASVLESGIMEQGGFTGFAGLIRQRLPHLPTFSMMSAGYDAMFEQALTAAADAEVIVLATRNGFIIPEQADKVQRIAETGHKIVHLCLRSPFDARLLPDASAIICTSGDATPSLLAAVDALTGQYTPTAALPFEI